MSSVLFDNWSINSIFGLEENVYGFIRQVRNYNDKNFSDLDRNTFEKVENGIMTLSGMDCICWQNIIMAIPSWDEIKVIRQYNIDSSIYEEILKPLCGIITYLGDGEEIETIEKIDHRIYHDMHYAAYREGYKSNFLIDGNLLQRTYIYITFSCTYGIDYIPHPYRSETIRVQSNFREDINRYCRNDILSKTDSVINEIFNELNAEIGREAFTFSYPILYNYIKRNTHSLQNEIDAAFKLRDQRDVRDFRNGLDKGSIIEVRYILKQIKEQARRIVDKLYREVKIGEISIGLQPTINVPLKFRRKNKIINMSFLTRLIDYSLKGENEKK